MASSGFGGNIAITTEEALYWKLKYEELKANYDALEKAFKESLEHYNDAIKQIESRFSWVNQQLEESSQK